MNATMTVPEALERLNKLYKGNQILLEQVRQYSESARALGIEHHTAAVETIFGAPPEDEVLLLDVPASVTPKSFSKEIAPLVDNNGKAHRNVTRVVYDPVNYKFYFFGTIPEVDATT